ncbi:MAG: CHAT domain-containing protein [Saprospiraceae bacterium]|nr:CHAT domain-containing protein [Saprospiraceae bacterium]
MYSTKPILSELFVLFILFIAGIGVQAQSPVFAPVDSLQKAGDLAGAAERCRQICDKLKNAENPNFAIVLEGLDKLGRMYLDQARPVDAAEAFGEAAQIAKAQSGATSADYGKYLNNQAVALQQAGRLKEALASSLLAMDIAEKTLGASHRTYGIRANTVGSSYYALLQYEQAAKYYKIAKGQALATMGRDHPTFLTRSGNYATCLFLTGHIDSALYHQRELLRTFERLGDTTGLNYASQLNNIGYSYIWTKQSDEALPYLHKAERLVEQLDKEKSLTLEVLKNIGSAYADMGETALGLGYFNRAMTWTQQNLPPGHKVYFDLIAELLLVYLHLGDKSNLLATAALLESGMEEVKDNEDPYRYGALAVTYSYLGDIARAEGFARQAVEGYQRLGAPPHLYYPHVGNWTTLALQQRKPDADLQLLGEAADWIEQHLNDVYSVMTESQRNRYQRSVEITAAMCEAIKAGHSEFNGKLLEQSLLLKSLSLTDYREMLAQFRNSAGDTATLAALEQWLDLRQQLARHYTTPEALQYLSETDVKKQIEQLELQLNQSYAPFRQLRKKIGWEDLQKTLKPQEAIVDFYGYLPTPGVDSLVYYAFVMRPGDTAPQWVELCSEEQLVRLLAGNTSQTAIYGSRGLRPQATGASTELYDRAWRPLDSLLRGVKKIYYSPSGWLYRVAFPAIPTPNGKTLGQRYNLECLTNLRALVADAPVNNAQAQTVALFGGVAYDHQQQTVQALETATERYRIAPAHAAAWPYLPGSETEVNKLSTLIKAKGIAAQVYIGADASEENFRNLGGQTASPTIIHLASHGFSFPRPKSLSPGNTADQQNPFIASANPLLRSGIVLAGANAAWQGRQILPSREDGILTSLEIANSNLSNTQLVVLSACESGLGDVNYQEGVFGLTRAFKQAGVEYLLVNLWPAPDKETVDFMEYFYSQYLKGLSLNEAFQKTQRKMRKRYGPDVGRGGC